MTKPTRPELKPCPFCGAVAEERVNVFKMDHANECPMLRAGHYGFFDKGVDFEKQAALWNTRAVPDTTAELVEALNDILTHYTELVNCGDCGHWDPEKEGPVIAARAALAHYQNTQP